MEYKPLADSYVSHSLTFRKVKREGDVAMFAAWQDGKPPVEWEVFIVQKHKASKFPSGKTYPPREAIPSDEEWGTCAWTCCSQERADFRFNMALKRTQEGQLPPTP